MCAETFKKTSAHNASKPQNLTGWENAGTRNTLHHEERGHAMCWEVVHIDYS